MPTRTPVSPEPVAACSGDSTTSAPSPQSEIRGGRTQENALSGMVATPRKPRVGQSCSIPTPLAIATDIASSGRVGIHSSVAAWTTTSTTAAAVAAGESGPADVKRTVGTRMHTRRATRPARPVRTRLW